MRALTYAAICGAILTIVTQAEAQSRRGLSIEVRPRSWLDAGNVAPVGSMNRYVHDSQGYGDAGRHGARSWSYNLPDRFSTTRGFLFESPIWWNVR